MTEELASPRRFAPAVAVGTALAAIVGAVLGLFGAVFGPFNIMFIGTLVGLVGVVGVARNGRWGFVVATLGAALIIGACLYIAIGILTPDGPGSGSGSGCAPSGTCATE